MTPHLFALPAQSTEAQARQCQRFMAELAGHPSALDPDEHDEPRPLPAVRHHPARPADRAMTAAPNVEASPHYWLGYLSGAIESVFERPAWLTPEAALKNLADAHARYLAEFKDGAS